MKNYLGKLVLIILFFIPFLTACENFVKEIIYDSRDQTAENVLILPKDYRLFGERGGPNFIQKKQDNSPIKVEGNIKEIGWNDTYILYRRTSYEGEEEAGLLNVKTDSITKLSSAMDIEKQLDKMGIPKIELKSVDQLFNDKIKK